MQIFGVCKSYDGNELAVLPGQGQQAEIYTCQSYQPSVNSTTAIVCTKKSQNCHFILFVYSIISKLSTHVTTIALVSHKTQSKILDISAGFAAFIHLIRSYFSFGNNCHLKAQFRKTHGHWLYFVFGPPQQAEHFTQSCGTP